MVTCDGCGRDFKSTQGLVGHQRLKHQETSVEDSLVYSPPAGDVPMNQLVDQKAVIAEAVEKVMAERQMADRVQELEAEIAELKGQHPSVVAAIAYAKGGSCPDCAEAWRDEKFKIIQAMLNGLTNKDILDLAIERNAIPTRIEIPD